MDRARNLKQVVSGLLAAVHRRIRGSFATGGLNLEELRCHRVRKAPSWMTSAG